MKNQKNALYPKNSCVLKRVMALIDCFFLCTNFHIQNPMCLHRAVAVLLGFCVTPQGAFQGVKLFWGDPKHSKYCNILILPVPLWSFSRCRCVVHMDDKRGDQSSLYMKHHQWCQNSAFAVYWYATCKTQEAEGETKNMVVGGPERIIEVNIYIIFYFLGKTYLTYQAPKYIEAHIK